MFIILSFALFIVFAPLASFSSKCDSTQSAKETSKYFTKQGSFRQSLQGELTCTYTIVAPISNSVIVFTFEGFTLPDKHYIKVYHDYFELLYSFSNKTQPRGYYEYPDKQVHIIFEVDKDAENSYFNFTISYTMTTLAIASLKLDASKSWNSATTFPIGKAVNKITLFQIIAVFQQQTILKINMPADLCHRFISNNRLQFYMGDKISFLNKAKIPACNSVGTYELNILSYNAIVVFNHYANESSSHLESIFSYASFSIEIEVENYVPIKGSWQYLTSPYYPNTFGRKMLTFYRIVSNDPQTVSIMFKMENCKFVDRYGTAAMLLFFNSNIFTPANIEKRFRCHERMGLPFRFDMKTKEVFIIFQSFDQFQSDKGYKFKLGYALET